MELLQVSGQQPLREIATSRSCNQQRQSKYKEKTKQNRNKDNAKTNKGSSHSERLPQAGPVISHLLRKTKQRQGRDNTKTKKRQSRTETKTQQRQTKDKKDKAKTKKRLHRVFFTALQHCRAHSQFIYSQVFPPVQVSTEIIFCAGHKLRPQCNFVEREEIFRYHILDKIQNLDTQTFYNILQYSTSPLF